LEDKVMPILQVKTIGAKQVWESPDGQRRIHELQLEWNGKTVKANTFSDAIAEAGWSGEVETYEKPGKGNNPAQTFVKQPPKENGGYPQATSTGSKYQPKDEKAIQAMWAIGQATVLHGQMQTGTKTELDFIETNAQELFLMVDRVKATPADRVDTPNEPESPPEPDVVHDPDQVEDIKGIFSDAEKAAEEIDVEDPWTPKG
jgi:hypothetical protein